MVAGATIIVSAVVALFGVASAVLGFIAEGTRLKANDIGVNNAGECVYPANPAFALALCAALLLLVAEIIASAAGGCCGCCRPGATAGYRAPKSKLIPGIVISILSWIAAVFAIWSYLQGATWNVPITHGSAAGGCSYLRGGVFSRAGGLSLVTTALGIVSYILLTARRPHGMAASAGNGPKPDGVQLGQPAYPPPAQGA